MHNSANPVILSKLSERVKLEDPLRGGLVIHDVLYFPAGTPFSVVFTEHQSKTTLLFFCRGGGGRTLKQTHHAHMG